jgi:hypothetical protein
MADIENLNKFRKQRQKTQSRKEAAENRIRFGRTRAQKEKDADNAKRARRELDLHRRSSLIDET